MIRSSRAVFTAVLLWCVPLLLPAQPGGVKPTTRQQFPVDPSAGVPALGALVSARTSELAEVVARFAADQQGLQRRYDAPDSPAQRARIRAFSSAWRARLGELAFDRLSQEGKADYVLLDNHLRYQLALMDRADVQRAEVQPLLPFADRALALQDARRDLTTIDAQASARTLADLTRVVDSLRTLLEPAPARPSGDSVNGAPRPTRVPAPKVSRTVGNRAAEQLDQIRNTVGVWYRYYNGYDPLFSWWATNPYQKLDEAMRRYATTIRTRVVGIQPAPVVAAAGSGSGGGAAQAPRNAAAANEPIIGDPIGADGLAADLRHAMIPYTADELIAIAEREYAFSLAEAKKAARELGLGDDWKAAMEQVKNKYVEPGKQPDLIRDLANEADTFFAAHDWVTIPALAREDWRMEMMAPERQRVSPFFLGGETIQVSYPTDAMTDDEKLMSMRGNNPHFSRIHGSDVLRLPPAPQFQARQVRPIYWLQKMQRSLLDR